MSNEELYKKDPVRFITEKYSEFLIFKESLKDIKNNIKEAENEDEEYLEIVQEIKEKEDDLKSLKEQRKLKKEEIKAKNYKMFIKKAEIENKIKKILAEITKAWIYKEEELEDFSPIIIESGRTKKQLKIEYSSKVKKEKLTEG